MLSSAPLSPERLGASFHSRGIKAALEVSLIADVRRYLVASALLLAHSNQHTEGLSPLLEDKLLFLDRTEISDLISALSDAVINA